MRVLALLATGLVLSAGCGTKESGPTRYQVSGTVTFDGKPVPAGTIYLEPSSGPAGFAQIVDGKYDTRSGKGHSGGAHNVLIEGFDGRATNPGEMGKPIFKPYRVEADLPKSDSTQNFDIPASAAEGLIISNDPA